ncbi:MAG: VOC family protein [Chloroflexi bacterium]|nr:VOC family protein [Chloroflexota bacterium]
MLKFDHIILAVSDLAEASRDFEAAGFTVSPGGVHSAGTTHNALVLLSDGAYLELIARTGAPTPEGSTDLTFLLEHGEGPVGLCLSSDDLDADAEKIRMRGASVNPPLDGGRVRPDGVWMQWRIAWVEELQLPFIIQDVTPRERRVPDDDLTALTHMNGARGLRGVNMRVGSASTMARLHAVFGEPVKAGARTVAFDCAGGIVHAEVTGITDAIESIVLSGIDTPFTVRNSRFVPVASVSA